jgi:hypothetical protein
LGELILDKHLIKDKKQKDDQKNLELTEEVISRIKARYFFLHPLIAVVFSFLKCL